MKMKLQESMKKAGMIGISLLIVVCMLLVAMPYVKPQTLVQEQDLYEYTITPKTTYEVYLVENNLYEENPQEEGKNYFTNLIQYIKSSFGFDIVASKEAQFKGEYEVIAEVVGYTNKGDTKEMIWSKSYPLSGKQAFEGVGERWSEEQALDINFHSYNQFAQAVGESVKVNLPSELVISMKGTIQIEAEGKVVEQPIHTSLTMPLGTQYFSILKQGVEPKSDRVRQNIEVKVEPSSTRTVGLVLLIGLGIGGLVFLMGFTVPPTGEDLKRIRAKKLFNQHGSRMVGVQEMNDTGYAERYKVSNMEDLIKIADELEKPVLYPYNRNLEKITRFYVMSGQTLYFYEINETSGKAKPVESISETVQDESI